MAPSAPLDLRQDYERQFSEIIAACPDEAIERILEICRQAVCLQSEFVIDGTRFFVMSNIDRSSIAWNDGVQSIFITGDLSSDEATQMTLTRQ